MTWNTDGFQDDFCWCVPQITLNYPVFFRTLTLNLIFNFACWARVSELLAGASDSAASCTHGWAESRQCLVMIEGQSAGLSKPGRISSNSTLLDWGAQSGERWSARPGWEWWLPGARLSRAGEKRAASPQEALWHSSLHFLNQSWVIRAATGKGTDQTIIPPRSPLRPFDRWQGRNSTVGIYLFSNLFLLEKNKKEIMCFFWCIFKF